MNLTEKKNVYIYQTSTSSETYDIIYPVLVLDLKASDTYNLNTTNKQKIYISDEFS